MKIEIFKNENFGEIRTMTNEKGETFFVGKDVAKSLGYSNTRDALNKHVDAEDKTTVAIRDTGSNYKTQAIIINESGLYALILSSKLPQAKKFKSWVTGEVLPQIRKTGGYIPTHDAQGRDLTDLEIMSRALEIQRRTIEDHKRLIEEMAPKAEYADEVLDSVSCLTTTQIAKELNMTAQELNRSLCSMKVQYGQSGQYLLYANYARQGLAQNRTHAYYDRFGDLHTQQQLVWTERGRRFIHNLF